MLVSRIRTIISRKRVRIISRTAKSSTQLLLKPVPSEYDMNTKSAATSSTPLMMEANEIRHISLMVV